MTESDQSKRYFPEDLGLVPVEPYNPRKVTTVADFMRQLGQTAFEGGNLGRSVETFLEMVTDKDTFVVMTSSGAMISAGMGLLICEMIDQGWVQAYVTTGATMAHGLVISAGLRHYRAPHHLSDEQLQDLKMNRIYTTLEPEQNLDHVEEIMNAVIDQVAKENPNKTFSSHLVTHEIGKYLHEHMPDRGILKSAYEQGVPVFIPAFGDSELGLDFKIGNDIRHHFGTKELHFDEFHDTHHHK